MVLTDGKNIRLTYSELGRLPAQLRGSGEYLWHRTTLLAYKAIMECGELRPNLGEFVDTTAQSKNSISRHLSAVALCDFDTESEENILAHYRDFWIPGVLIRIRQAELDSAKLISSACVTPLAQERGLIYVPYIEALYCGSIPTTAFEGEPIHDS